MSGLRALILATLGLAFVVVVVVVGAYVRLSDAGLACPDLPLCLGQVVPPMDFGNAFHVVRELGRTGQGELLPREALTAIHWAHRVFALVVVAAVGWVSLKALLVAGLRRLAALIGVLVVLQFLLGISNVAFGLPLALAAAHNAGAALLLLALVVLNFFAFRGLRPSR